jgi:hypothetical protein
MHRLRTSQVLKGRASCSYSATGILSRNMMRLADTAHALAVHSTAARTEPPVDENVELAVVEPGHGIRACCAGQAMYRRNRRIILPSVAIARIRLA